MGKKFLKIVSILTLITTLFTVTVGAFAVNTLNPASSVSKQKIDQLESIRQKNDIAIAKMEQYIKVSKDGTLTLNVPKNVANSIDKVTYDSLVAAFNNTNSLIKSGDLKVGSNLKMTPSNQLTNKIMAAYSNGNYMGCEFYWWGFYLYFDSTACNKARSSYAALGAVISVYSQAFLGKGMGKVLTTVVQAALWGAAWIFDYYNSAGRGIVVRFTYCPVPVFTGVWSQ